MAKIITSAEFEAEVLKSGIPVMVDFFATWCGPCKMIAPALDELAAEYEGRAKVVKVDVDQNGELAKTYKVRSVPTILYFKEGKIADTQIGASSKQDMAGKIDALL